MKYFKDVSVAPPLSAVRNKLLRDKENRIIEDINRLKQLKKIDTNKLSRRELLDIFTRGSGNNNF